MKALRFFHLTALFWCVEAALGMEETSYVSNCRDGATVSLVSANPRQANPVAFNSITTCRIATPDWVAHSDSNGVWSMPGIDFVNDDSPISVDATFEAEAGEPLRTSRMTLQLEPDPGTQLRPNVALQFGLAPPILVAGRIVDFTTGNPVAGAGVHRNVLFTTITGSSALTDHAGCFELQIHEALPVLWFVVYREGFATVTAATAMREHPTRDWADTQGFRVGLRPLVEVSGVLRDSHGNPPDEPVELFATFEDLIDRVWKGSGTDGEAQVAADGLFSGILPAGPITLALRGPPQQMGSGSGPGLPPRTLRLVQEVDIPAEGKKGWQLTASRSGHSE